MRRISRGNSPRASKSVARPLLLIDAPSLYFRAYFGIPESAAKAPDGTAVNAVRGFLDMLATLVRTRRPDRVICALDADWRPAWRVALLPSYKAHRLAPGGGTEEVVPDGLVPQIPVLLDMLAALGIPALGAAGYEADDVLGTLATRHPGPIEVASGDRDLFQLVDDAKPVRLLYCGRGVAKLEVFDDAAVRAKYGVPAGGYADFAALRGDPSDGLPGVAGIGEKTAARLVSEYPTLDDLVAARDRLPPRVAAALAGAGEYLEAMRVVVPVATKLDVESTTPAEPDPERLQELAERHRLSGPVRRLLQAMRDAGLSSVDPPPAG